MYTQTDTVGLTSNILSGFYPKNPIPSKPYQDISSYVEFLVDLVWSPGSC
jgi:hypothetical protein